MLASRELRGAFGMLFKLSAGARWLPWSGSERSAPLVEGAQRPRLGLGNHKELKPCPTLGDEVLDEQGRPTGDWLLYGLVNGLQWELGYCSLLDLQRQQGRFGLGIERDMYWTSKPLREVAPDFFESFIAAV